MRRAILASGAAIGGLRLAGIGLGFLVTIVIGRTLGPAGLGAYGYATIVLSLLAVPVSYGWASLLLREISAAAHGSRWSESKGLFIRGTHAAAIMTIGMTLVALAFAGHLRFLPATSAGWATILLLAAVFFLDQFSALRLAMLRGLHHPIWGQVPEMLIRPTLIVLLFAALASALGDAISLEHAFLAMAIAAATCAVAGAVILWRIAPAALTTAHATFHTRAWLASALLLAVNSGLVLLNSYIDVLILGALGTMEQVGVYRVATQVALLSGFAYTALNMLAVPRFSYFHAAADRKALQESAVFMARIALLGALPLPIVFLLFGAPIIDATFGPGFAAAREPMFPLFIAQVVNAAAGMASSLFVARGREASLVRFTMVAVAVNAALSTLLIPRWGAMGAAIGSMSATIVWNVSMWVYAMRSLKIDTSVIGWEREA